MGLYLKLNDNNNLSEILELYNNLLESLENSFNLAFFDKNAFKLIEDREHERIMWGSKTFEKELVLKAIKEDMDKSKEKVYTITGEGVIYLQINNKLGGMVVDINAFYLNSDSELYGDVYVSFYDSNIKWENYFFLDNSDCVDNFNLIGFVGNFLKEKFKLKYAFIGTYENFQDMLLNMDLRE
jgi:hypothetical protein